MKVPSWSGSVRTTVNRGVSGSDLEYEHFEVVPLEQMVVVGLQLLHLHRLFVQPLLHLLHAAADFARALQQLVHVVGRAQVRLGQAADVSLHHPHGTLQVRLPLLHALLVLLHGLQHVHQLVQQRHHRDGAHLAALRGAPGGRASCRAARLSAQSHPQTGQRARGGGRRRSRAGAEAGDQNLGAFRDLERGQGQSVGAARGAAALGVGRVLFHVCGAHGVSAEQV